jgi:homoserine dehydrogenase
MARTTSLPEALPVPVAVVGFGRVARALTAELAGRPELRVVGIADSRTVAFDADGLRRAAALGPAALAGETVGDAAGRALLERLPELPGPGILVELTPVNAATGEPARTHLERALRHGWDVVTANKGPIALAGPALAAEAARRGRRLGFGATVGGAVPVLETLSGPLAGAGLEGVTGIVNGTGQFILGGIAEGLGWREALDRARAAGLTERDPAADLDGVDAALKASILHWVAFGTPLPPSRIPRDPIDPGLVPRAVAASRRGQRLISVAEVRAGHAEVRLRAVPRGGIWDAPGAANVFHLPTARAGSVWLSGIGAGPGPTASALLGEILALARPHLLPARRPATYPGTAAVRTPAPLLAEAHVH